MEKITVRCKLLAYVSLMANYFYRTYVVRVVKFVFFSAAVVNFWVLSGYFRWWSKDWDW